MLDYYVYAYLRDDGTPYYVGKGKDNRAFNTKAHRGITPKDRSRIAFLERNLTDLGSLALERRYVAWYGRKDRGGILWNFTDGGDGSVGTIRQPLSSDVKEKISTSLKGNVPWNKGISQTEETKIKIALTLKGRVLHLEHRINMSAGRIGIRPSAESIAKAKETRIRNASRPDRPAPGQSARSLARRRRMYK